MKSPFLLFLLPLMLLTSCSTNTGRFVSSEAQLLIPDISEQDQNNQFISLRDYSRNDYLLVFFYPEADTPGWIKQCKALESSAQKLAQANVRALGVSMDSVPKQLAFAQKYNLTFPLLCDTDGSMCDAFEVPHPNNRPARNSFLFYNQQLIWIDQQVVPDQHIQHALEAVTEHRSSLTRP